MTIGMESLRSSCRSSIYQITFLRKTAEPTHCQLILNRLSLHRSISPSPCLHFLLIKYPSDREETIGRLLVSCPSPHLSVTQSLRRSLQNPHHITPDVHAEGLHAFGNGKGDCINALLPVFFSNYLNNSFGFGGIVGLNCWIGYH
jgi:hypothetical protein